MNFLQDNGAWIAGFAVAGTTVVLVLINWRLIRQNSILVQKSFVQALISNVIDPLLVRVRDNVKFAEPGGYYWAWRNEQDLDVRLDDEEKTLFGVGDDRCYVPTHRDLLIFGRLTYGIDNFSSWHWEDFKDREPSIAKLIFEYDDSKPDFHELITELAKEMILGLDNSLSDILLEEVRQVKLHLAKLMFCRLLYSEEMFKVFLERFDDNEESCRARELWRNSEEALLAFLSDDKRIGKLNSEIIRQSETVCSQLEKTQDLLEKVKRKYMNRFHIPEVELPKPPPGVM